MRIKKLLTDLMLTHLPLPRLSGWAMIAAMLLLAVYLLAPQQLPVLLYKATLVVLGAVLAYRIDRAIFPYARPHMLLDKDVDLATALLFSAATLRRALMVVACVLGLTLGL